MQPLIECRAARLTDAPAYRRYEAECGAAGLPLYQVAQFGSTQWLQELLAHANGLHLPPGYLPTTTYFALEGEALLATLRLHHGDKPSHPPVAWLYRLRDHPTRRGEGAARILLG